jgi:predicted ester cyclase
MALADDLEHPHTRFVRQYFDALEQDADGMRLASFFTPGVRQHELPNRLTENGAERDLAQLLEGSAKGRQVVEQQRYEIKNAIVSGDRLAIEMEWSARLKVPFRSIPVGGLMRATCAVFFRFTDGRIAEQHNFDCFEPF